MDQRQAVAYFIIAAIVVFLGSVWLYTTRERRAHRAAVRRAQQRKRERLDEE